MSQFQHETVLLHETVDAIRPDTDGMYIDCTLGGAGHTREILRRSSPSGRVLCLDQDLVALANARVLLEEVNPQRVHLVHSNFREVDTVAKAQGFVGVQGIVFDLGVSSPQFDEAERGFSYRLDAKLDMRMDTTRDLTAETIVNTWDETDLANIFYRYGEEKFSRRIAKAIVLARSEKPIETTAELAQLVKTAIPAATRRTGGHPAKRVFQGLRIAVNDELTVLEEALQKAFTLLDQGGRMAVISFHSLEDRIVKQTFAEWAKGCVCPPDFPVCRCGRTPRGALVARKPIVATEAELERNPRSRSAKLRVIERLPE